MQCQGAATKQGFDAMLDLAVDVQECTACAVAIEHNRWTDSEFTARYFEKDMIYLWFGHKRSSAQFAATMSPSGRAPILTKSGSVQFTTTAVQCNGYMLKKTGAPGSTSMFKTHSWNSRYFKLDSSQNLLWAKSDDQSSSRFKSVSLAHAHFLDSANPSKPNRFGLRLHDPDDPLSEARREIWLQASDEADFHMWSTVVRSSVGNPGRLRHT